MTIRLTEKRDVEILAVSNEEILALGGDDVVTVRGNGNRIDGGRGNDVLTVSAATFPFEFDATATTTLAGGAGDDRLTASAIASTDRGDPTLNVSLVATNTLAGGAGDDVLTASAVAASSGGHTSATNDLAGGDTLTATATISVSVRKDHVVAEALAIRRSMSRIMARRRRASAVRARVS